MDSTHPAWIDPKYAAPEWKQNPPKRIMTEEEAMELLRELRPKLEAGLKYLRDKGD